ncbi:efflux RND transporter periplasmic adaptor subunit [Alteribacillus iranensis]|uniref:RND family efflux transporter, MFP subunit n=1 Tax=Alteribacillus iranensis TaxID=930128 RepID=A0A1I2BUS6_9BACI|nr:efflux RND transporter periplasmic adaptor subunit [Alteribacillus iranensis]SFE59869.1 RND family efflux transporter, MFP subunit [Alteribacillus iranensis]
MGLHMSKIWKGVLGAAFLSTAVACQSAEVDTAAEEEAVPVETAVAVSGSMEGDHTISATTEAMSEVSLTPELNAKIEEIRVKKGDYVEEGQVLAVLDDTDLRHALEQERAAYERAKSSVSISESGKKGAEANADQSKVALENADYAIQQAKEQYDQARINLQEAKENEGSGVSAAERSVETAKRTVESAKQSLETAKRNLANAERDRDRSQEMLNAGLISEQEMEQAEAAVDDARDRVTEAETAVTDAESNVSEAEDNLEQARQTYDIDLLQSQVTQAKAAWEEAQAAKKELRTRIDASNATVEEAEGGIQDANAALEQARIAVEQAEENLDDAVVRAPSSGKVLEINSEPGELYAQQEPMLLLGEMNVLKAAASVTPQQLMLFTEGQSINVHFPSLERDVPGTVDYIASTADDNGMFTVEVQIPNTGDELQAGIYSELLIEETLIDNGIIIPTEAIIDIEGQPSVFVVEENKAVLVPVEVLREESDVSAVDAELSPDSKVVTRGQFFLTDGALVEDVTEVEEEAPAEEEDAAEESEETAEEETPSEDEEAEGGGE